MSKPKTPASIAKGTPKPSASSITPRARREMYDSFRAHTQEVRETLVAILRDETADKGHRIQAGKEILNRGWGQAPSIEVVEQVFKHEHSFDLEALRNMPAKDLAALERAFSLLIRADVPDAEVIEHKP